MTFIVLMLIMSCSLHPAVSLLLNFFDSNIIILKSNFPQHFPESLQVILDCCLSSVFLYINILVANLTKMRTRMSVSDSFVLAN